MFLLHVRVQTMVVSFQSVRRIGSGNFRDFQGIELTIVGASDLFCYKSTADSCGLDNIWLKWFEWEGDIEGYIEGDIESDMKGDEIFTN